MNELSSYHAKTLLTIAFLALCSLGFSQTLTPLACYPLETDFNDALGISGPMYSQGTAPSGGTCLTPPQYAGTPNFSDLDPNNIEFSLDFNLSAYSNNAIREGTILILGGSYRPLGIIVGRSGHIGFKYNNHMNQLSSTIVNLNQWYNVRLNLSSGVINLYLDNVLVHTFNTGGINYHPSFPNIDASFLTRDFSGGTVQIPMCIKNVKIATVYDPPGPGAALSSNGGSQLVSVPDDPSLDLGCAMTLEAWVNLSSPYIWGAILLKASGNSWGNGYGIYARYNQIVFMPRGFSQQHFSGYDLPLNTWTHVACTYDGATSKIYINGNLVSTQAISGDIPQNNFPLGIGGDPGFTPFTFRGAIDEVRIWNQVLEQSDIQAAMNCEIQTTDACLVANYHFNQGIAGGNNAGETTLIDASAYGNNGTLQGYALNGPSSNWVAPGAVTSGAACNTSYSCDPNFACCEGPDAVCMNTTVYLNANGTVSITPANVDGGSSASCGLQSMTVWPNYFTCGNIGPNWVTLTVTDVNGDTDQCNAWVTVADNIPPSPVCLHPTVFLQPDGTYGLQNSQVLDFANTTDNCNFYVSNISPSVVDCGDFNQTVPVLVTVSDGSNSVQCIANVNVQKGDALPSAWDHDDIGGATGDAGFDPCDEKYFVESNGITHPLSDKIHMAWTYRYGDFDIIAEVTSITAGGLAGIIARESLAGGSKKVALRTQLANFVHRDIRYTTDGYQVSQQLFRPQHNWLRLKRIGNLFLGYTSMDGNAWKFAFFTTVNIDACLYVGLFAEGPIDNTTSVACFENVSVSGSGCGELELVDLNNNNRTTDEIRHGQDFNVFPNPASTDINIRITEVQTETQLLIQDQLGRVIEAVNLEPGQTTFNVNIEDSRYQNGIYLVTLLSESGAISKKIVIAK